MTGPDMRALVEGASSILADAGVQSPRHDATALAAHVLGQERLELALAPPVPDGFAEEFAGLVERRRNREPLQHLVGSTGFRYLTLLVEPGVFVPRPETEVVAQVAIEEAARLDGPARRRPLLRRRRASRCRSPPRSPEPGWSRWTCPWRPST